MEDAPPAPKPILLADYRPPAFLIDAVTLEFSLHPTATRVRSTLVVRANPEADPGQDLFLHGEGLRLIEARLDGRRLTASEYLLTSRGLTVAADRLPGPHFTWSAEVEIDPSANTALEGLYMSNGMYCTQCEAEGFRKIAFYPDRPDVMAPFDVRIDSTLPVRLSNGNPVSVAPGQMAEWSDPWPKPAYLFALVAGDLTAHSDAFVTRSGRAVTLNIWVRPGDEDRCAYAMDALKRAMRWDERVYGREYDLDVFNIVAVDDFNMGAMENKSLNIFNAKYVLASPETATDRDHEMIEGIVAHEYFHNWTGNRITCRDWFQLCLKEGLTVFRDQQFSADTRGEAVRRIDDVLRLRARQFREDSGPLAHNVRPESYIEINNFYTATVYEKGAEVIRMLRLLVGADAYAAALDLYFRRHDGRACTIEDWLAVFEDTTARDLGQFKRWYTQAGTPRVRAAWRRTGGALSLTLSQEVPPTPDQPHKAPAMIPVRLALLAETGATLLPDTVIELDAPEMTLRFDLDALAQAAGIPVPGRVVPSILRGFSAPVILDADPSAADRALLLAHDDDPFNRWEAGRSLMQEGLLAMLTAGTDPDPAHLDALDRVIRDTSLDPAYRALMLGRPSEDDLAQAATEIGIVPDPDAIHAARRHFSASLARGLRDTLTGLYEAFAPAATYSPDAAQAARRGLRNTCLELLAPLDGPDRARAQYRAAGNMTDRMAAFVVLLDAGDTDVARDFHDRWSSDRLVIDKWFTAQITHAAPRDAVATAERLAGHPDFDWRNPNRFRALMAGLTAGNPAGFHQPSGAGYRFLADWLIRLDARNPQTAARMSTAFETWRRYDADRQALIGTELDRIAAAPGLSRDLGEMIGRMRGARIDPTRRR